MLHIHNGDSSAGTARNADIPGEHLAWREAMVCGPTPAGLSNDEFREIRARHLAEGYDVEVDKCASELRRQEEELEKFADHEEIVLWFEHDLFCQVHLAYLLNWFTRRDMGKTKLSLICIDRFQGVDDFRGLGQLNEPQLKSLLPQRTQVSEAQLQLGVRAWAAYSASTPAQIEFLLSEDAAALPFLKPALAKHLERFPSVRNGLGRIENVLLKLVAGGQENFAALFSAFQQREPLYGFGDAQIFLHLKRLANASHALLTIRDGNADALDSVKLADTSFQITAEGKRVLAGQADFVQLDGIDLWLGGVHLKGNEAAWRWDEKLRRLQSAD